jgi:hypothetical protein
MAKANFVKAAQKDYPEHNIKKGESYYWWKLHRGAKRFSKTRPKRSQLTGSSFYATLYDIEDDMIGDAEASEELGSLRDEVVSALEELRDQCEESRNNMPDALQDSDTGNMLQERYDALDSAIDEFQNIELGEPDENDLVEHGWEELEREPGETDEDFEGRKQEARDEAVQEYWNGKLEEFQAVSIDAP